MTDATALKRPQAMMFDMDGTLFETETVLLPAYHNTFEILREEGLYHGETPPDEIILGCLGMLLEDIWARVMPGAEPRTIARANQLLLDLQLDGMRAGTSRLYPHVMETLTYLHEQGVRLFIASNGLEGYVKGIVEVHEIGSLLEGVYSAGEYQTASKVDLVGLLLDNHTIDSAWMVGDRSSDVEAGLKNGQTVIGCNYADFGDTSELEGADVIITSFDQLRQLYDEAR
ncbi:HAD hydrolase-like protein [Paenibacillus wulumuqiensis]|uniref:HAD hydrolase-like protein n=1 Tax=Paenibacillus wulumuqiensis TaxID=1567107 RepID=UPI000619EA23|nr:HAD hydrolase-like protein [Paenibacillus wulumuqiensis]